MSFWGKIENYLPVIVLTCFLLPWVCLAAWYFAVVQGCASYETRSSLESFCMKRHANLGTGTPWYLDLSNESNADSSNTLSQYTETILISHLNITDARRGLEQQDFVSKAITPGTISAYDLSISLGMSQAPIIPMQILYTPAYCPGPDQAIGIVSEFAPLLDTFSSRLCEGKDIMANALRTFVESYPMIASLSHFRDLTLPSIFLFPGFHLVRLISQQSLWPWLPKAKLYTFQVRAEIQFRKQQIRHEIKAAFDIIDASLATIQLFQDSSWPVRCLDSAIFDMTIHQHMVREMIDKSNSSLWHWVRGSDETAKLERDHKLGERVRRHLLEVRETMHEYEVYCSRLRSHLEFFSQIFESLPLVRLSTRSSFKAPEPLLEHVRRISLLSPGKSSNIDEDGDSRDFTRITSLFRVFLYDPASVDDTRLSGLRSEVAQLCKAGKYVMMGSHDLFSICVLYNLIATTPALDDDPLSCPETRWTVERREAIRRWEQGKRLYNDPAMYEHNSFW